jgi:2-methylisocitrate lyase-like PEP mutase family enzyme
MSAVVSQAEKAVQFQALHRRPAAFVIPNPWDSGSARLLASLGFEALATSSGALAVTLGLRDGAISREHALAHAAQVAAATSLPVTADLENGYGDAPETVAETLRLSAEAGVVGGSIEDATGHETRRIYDLSHAVERIQAAVAAVRTLPTPFVLTARAENFLRGRPDLDDTIRRLQAFEAAGADVLYAPNLPDIESIRLVCSAVTKPVNVIVGSPGLCFPVSALAEAGVRRISLGPALLQTAITATVRAVKDIQTQGNFAFAEHALTFGDLTRLMSRTI